VDVGFCSRCDNHGVARAFIPIVVQAPNTVVSHAHLRKAIFAVHSEKPCIFKKEPEMQSLSLSSTIRQMLAKFRDCKKDEVMCRKVKSKASMIVMMGFTQVYGVW
jgi:hypothetical protein